MTDKTELPMQLSDMTPENFSIWMVNLFKNNTQSRSTLFRYIFQFMLLILITNSAGIIFIFSVLVAHKFAEKFHWLFFTNVFAFMLGIVFSIVGILIFISIVIKETNDTELLFHKFINDEISWKNMMLYNNKKLFKIASLSAEFGIIGTALATIGTIISLIVLCLLY